MFIAQIQSSKEGTNKEEATIAVLRPELGKRNIASWVIEIV
jgi:hypothetical protein